MAIGPSVADAQFADLRARAGNRILVALTTGLCVVQGAKAVAELLEFIE
jgi:hypothetical protein